MPSLQIRDLPDDVYQALAFRAERDHRSLAQQAIVELRRMPSLLAAERRREVLAQLRERAATRADRLAPSPEALVRQDRER